MPKVLPQSRLTMAQDKTTQQSVKADIWGLRFLVWSYLGKLPKNDSLQSQACRLFFFFYISRIMNGQKMSSEEADYIYHQHYTAIDYNRYLQMRNHEKAKLCLKKQIEKWEEYSSQNHTEYDNSF